MKLGMNDVWARGYKVTGQIIRANKTTGLFELRGCSAVFIRCGAVPRT